jgi:hypothetical protein
MNKTRYPEKDRKTERERERERERGELLGLITQERERERALPSVGDARVGGEDEDEGVLSV